MAIMNEVADGEDRKKKSLVFSPFAQPGWLISYLCTIAYLGNKHTVTNNRDMQDMTRVLPPAMLVGSS